MDVSLEYNTDGAKHRNYIMPVIIRAANPKPQRKMNNMLLISVLFLSLTGNYFFTLIKRHIDRLPYNVLRKIKRGTNIDVFLSQLGHTLNASRTAIIEFDKGCATMTYEWTNSITGRIINLFQNIRTSSLGEMLLELEMSGMIVVDEHSNPDIILIHESIGVKTSYKFRIYKTISKGCLIVAFDKTVVLTPQQIDFIKSELNRLRLIYK